MNYSSTYKKLIASALLALYSFICLPASAWHSHNKTQSGSVGITKGKESLIAVNDNSEGACKICAHHYQLHCNDAAVPVSSDLTLSAIDKPYQTQFLPETPVYRFLNKGPPVLS